MRIGKVGYRTGPYPIPALVSVLYRIEHNYYLIGRSKLNQIRGELVQISCKLKKHTVADRKRAEADRKRDIQTGPADDIQADPARSKSNLVNQNRAELKAEELYSVRRAEFSYKVQIHLT
ncbi:hypothetical protein F511_17197 [Dorcoceras hygrometricum]|uniref:Uncharacterized protein n=1 Tax=Dorcoceras hygrometricum TaxID=472368 RepID=A0A2Z7BQK3_9LAMI|nr:hypothetical protein F511_17197 [Dorcoceras hygrometricum]